MAIHAVAIVIYEGVQALDVAGPVDVFAEANHFLDSGDRYETVLVGESQRQGGQSQFSPYLTARADPASPAARIQDHVMTNIGSRHTLEALAGAVGMSPRNLARHFVQETGITPHEFVERARVDAARMMLEGSDRPLKTVAYDAGSARRTECGLCSAIVSV